MRICVVGGAGHVGLPLAMMLANAGFHTDILDINIDVMEQIRSGKMPFIEKGADELLPKVLASGLLKLTNDNAIISKVDVVICVIGTPVDEYLNPETVRFYRVIEQMRPHFRDGQTLILRSTVYPGLTNRINAMFREHGPNVHVCFCPERVAQGHSLKEIAEIPQIISGFSEEGLRTARVVCGAVAKELIEVAPLEAELAKLMCNCYRYITFAIANQFYMLASDHGINYDKVAHAASWHNPRTKDMPRPGLAAGPCLLKDTMQLAAFSNNNFFLGHAAMLVNEGFPQFIVNMIRRDGNLKTKRVGILGMTFKADCDDIRDSLSFKLKKLLQLETSQVKTHDPFLADSSALDEVIDGSDVIVIGVPHREYRGLKLPDRVTSYDVWNCLAP